MTITHRERLTAALLLLLPLAGGAAAQSTNPAPTPAKPAAVAVTTTPDQEFIESVTVNVVNVDVYATDKKTHSFVPGLTKNDFEVYEDGRPMAITNFYSIEGGRPSEPAGAGAPPPPLSAAAAAEAKFAPVPEDQRLRLIVYIDNFNLKPFDRNKVMRSVRIFLDQKLHRDDQVMLVTYDRELHVRQSFTSDPGLVNNLLLDTEKVSAQGVHAESDRREVLREIDDAQSAAQALGFARTYAAGLHNDVQFTLDALRNMVTMLAGMPGRKAVLYVSDGIPMISGYDVFYAVQDKFKEQAPALSAITEFDSSRKLEELANAANANRVTFYTIDAGGLRVLSSYTAENARPGAGAMTDQMSIQNSQDSIVMLAERTGGISVLNANDVAPHLDRIGRDFTSFYSLGYSPNHHGDGRFHKITVKVKRKGVELRHREGYRDKDTETQMNEITLAALQFPFDTNPLGVGLSFGRPARRADGLYQVPVVVRIPLGKLLFVPRPTTHEGRIRLFIAAMDTDGNTSDVSQTPLGISVPLADVSTIGAKYYTYSVTLLMRPGEQRVAIGLRDEVASQQSVVTGGIRVGA
jgi:VWFA-related protein